ncbi:hypothetical protein BDA96_06G235700 [Sorghum bicolor]|uniref:F-box associated domain-containing protein n=2 Tax=Sorghum bicolor TaxID=4558 RepID=A0A921QTL3_SORBI|nr:uncharacterized protein LOC110436220 [Sorghum bicolor]KAG0527464.1 hypothetical protein BDA96_06G235700 [Sorghum bicolor]KXG27117.1 hypothetical protein SORBI_3006G215500 [Sorghum bicolor]|eukprot:XP_021318341.1 uncharacterized protein LOC110436220 [Sorghum bicolor]
MIPSCHRTTRWCSYTCFLDCCLLRTRNGRRRRTRRTSSRRGAGGGKRGPSSAKGCPQGLLPTSSPEADYIYERHSVYLRGKLYVHCQNHTVMRMNLSNNSYRVIKCPTVSQMAGVGVLSLGKSERGVYSGVPWNDGWPRFQVWFLNESSEQMEWILKSNISLQAVLQNFPLLSNHNIIYGSWAVTSNKSINEHVERAGAQEEFEWDSDDGVLLETKDDDDGTYYNRQTSFLGFHPFKEIAFFRVSRSRVVSYHLNTLYVQYLGILNAHSVYKSFPYTSCWMGELRENN